MLWTREFLFPVAEKKQTSLLSQSPFIAVNFLEILVSGLQLTLSSATLWLLFLAWLTACIAVSTMQWGSLIIQARGEAFSNPGWTGFCKEMLTKDRCSVSCDHYWRENSDTVFGGMVVTEHCFLKACLSSVGLLPVEFYQKWRESSQGCRWVTVLDCLPALVSKFSKWIAHFFDWVSSPRADSQPLSSRHPARLLSVLQGQRQHTRLLGHVLQPANWTDGINTHEPGEAQVAQLVTLAAWRDSLPWKGVWLNSDWMQQLRINQIMSLWI